jgi:hypothetical protein
VKLQLNYFLSVAALALFTNIISPTLSRIVLSIALQAALAAGFLHSFLTGGALPHLFSVD